MAGADAERPSSLTLDLPGWLRHELAEDVGRYADDASRMRRVLACARRNVAERTGGPFAAGVFERESGRLLMLGVNRVVPLNCSSAHAEIVALSLAQQRIGNYDLGAPGLPALQLVASWAPCAMCFGAILWSGVRSLVIPAQGSPLPEITGFDEGPLPAGWRDELRQRGIELIEGIEKDEAVAVLRAYAASGAPVYNGRGGSRA